MNDLILRTKVEILEQNLAEILKFVEVVKDRQRELIQLSGLLGQSIPSAEAVLYAIDPPKSLLKRSGQVEGELQLEEVKKKIVTIRDMLEQAMKIVTDIQTRYVEINEDLDQTLRKELGIQARVSSSILDEIHRKRKAAQEAESKGDTSTVEDLLQKSWKLYADKVYKSSQRIFEEYVDFLGGLALRDEFVDLGICQIADELIVKWGKAAVTAWGSLTIPARKETLEASIARIIRLGFPEWTIWALPLTARGFGDVVIKQSEELKQYIEDHAAGDRARAHLHNFFADAFATYAMGPAYVYAAILLRFDPLSAYIDKHDEPAGARRAYVMLTMLKQMKKAALEKRVPDPYSDIINKVEEEWNAALLQAKASGALQAADEEQLEQWVTYLFNYLKVYTYDDMLFSHKLWLRFRIRNCRASSCRMTLRRLTWIRSSCAMY